MSDDRQTAPGEFLSPRAGSVKEEKSLAPWLIAGAVVLVIVGVLVGISLSSRTGTNTAGGLSAAYVSHLSLSNLELSQSSNIAGSQITYVDGQITNSGNKVVTGVEVRTIFHDAGGNVVQTDPPAFQLIRTRTPYVDVESVASDLVKPGEIRPFRITFEHVPDAWDQKNPKVEIVGAVTR